MSTRFSSATIVRGVENGEDVGHTWVLDGENNSSCIYLRLNFLTTKNMRKLLSILSLAFILIGCSSNDSSTPSTDGPGEPMEWQSEQQITKENGINCISIPAEGEVISFVCTNYDSFRLADVKENGEMVSIDNPLIAKGNWFEVKIINKQMTITFNQNTEYERNLSLTVQTGDCFCKFLFKQQTK